jgi:hypothetical protein
MTGATFSGIVRPKRIDRAFTSSDPWKPSN